MDCIKDYEGIYQVSNLGRIRSLDRTLPTARGRNQTFFGRILRPNIHNDGYHARSLQKCGKITIKLVHRIVAAAFIGEPSDGMEVNHKNGDKSDNSIDNLEYLTPSQNCIHAHRTGLRVSPKGSESRNSILTENDVTEIVSLFGKKTMKDIAKQFGVHDTTVNCIAKGKTWSHHTGIIRSKES